MGIYKKKSIPKSRNENKLSQDGTTIKNQTQINNFLNNNNQTNSNNNLSNRKNKNMTSINNYNLNYKQSIQKSRNQQQSISINSNNTNSKYGSFDKINNNKKKVNMNLIKNNNIEFILNQLKIHPFCTLKKSSCKKNNMSNNNDNGDKKAYKVSGAVSIEHASSEIENDRKNKTINNNKNTNENHREVRPSSHKQKFQNSPSAFDFLKKTAEYIKGTINTKTNSYSKDMRVNKKSARNCSYNDSQKSYNETGVMNNNKNKNTINSKISFDGILSNKVVHQRRTSAMSNGTKHIHNVNININNQINIGGKQFHELLAFSDMNKKNYFNNNINSKNLCSLLNNKDKLFDGKKNIYISRNKNQSLDFNSLTNNTNNPTNNPSSYGNHKMNSINDIHNSGNNMYKTQYKINSEIKNSVSNFNNSKKKQNKKIRLTSNTLFRSMKAINNNNANEKNNNNKGGEGNHHSKGKMSGNFN